MKLIYYIILRITLALTLILTVWAIFFYVTMIDEVNDEVDDALEDYSETIIIRALAGEELPSKTNGSNNQYYMMEVSKEYAESREDIQYKDSMVYIEEKGETEPALDVTTNLLAQLSGIAVFIDINQLRFQAAKPAFHYHIIHPSSFSVHTLADILRFQKFNIVIACKLAALIRIDNFRIAV